MASVMISQTKGARDMAHNLACPYCGSPDVGPVVALPYVYCRACGASWGDVRYLHVEEGERPSLPPEVYVEAFCVQLQMMPDLTSPHFFQDVFHESQPARIAACLANCYRWGTHYAWASFGLQLAIGLVDMRERAREAYCAHPELLFPEGQVCPNCEEGRETRIHKDAAGVWRCDVCGELWEGVPNAAVCPECGSLDVEVASDDESLCATCGALWEDYA